MKSLNFVHLVMFFMLLLGCGGSGSSNAPGKNLFSTWTSTTTAMVIDMTGGQFSTPLLMDWEFSSGAICQCDINIVGADNSGSYTISNSVYVSGGGGDPGCAALNQTGTYLNSGATLSTCKNGGPICTYWN